MDHLPDLTDRTAFAYALHMYNNPSCTGIDEFNEDYVRIKYTKRLIQRYVRTGDTPLRLMLNHIIALSNVFHPEGLTRMLFLRVDPDAWCALKTTLTFLSLMPPRVQPVNGFLIVSDDLPLDQHLWKLLHEAVDVHQKHP